MTISYEGILCDFAVTLECNIQGDWKAVARYDTTGGIVHRDRLKPDGSYLTHREKVNMGDDWSDALNACSEDLMKRYAFYVTKFKGMLT